MPGLKDHIGPETIERLATALASADSSFPRHEFERNAARGLEELELKARIDQVARALGDALPGEFGATAPNVETAVEDSALGVWELWPVTVWIGHAGVDHIDAAARLLARITPRSSGEFGIRPLIEADPERMLAILIEWARSDDEHVRRLASEGPRPLLPWAPRLALTSSNPGWALPVLDVLTDDPSRYVRRSVANHLNDISKLDRDLAIAVATQWRLRPGNHMESILAHGLRTLVKRGESEALALVGLDSDAAISVERLSAFPAIVRIGETVDLLFELRSTANRPVTVAGAYVLEFARPNGRQSRKLFTLGTISLTPGEAIKFRRRYAFRPLSTRVHCPGSHAVELLINGTTLARAEFSLEA